MFIIICFLNVYHGFRCVITQHITYFINCVFLHLYLLFKLLCTPGACIVMYKQPGKSNCAFGFFTNVIFTHSQHRK